MARHRYSSWGDWFNPWSYSYSAVNRLKGIIAFSILAACTGGLGYLLGGISGIYWGLGLPAAMSFLLTWFSKEITFWLYSVKKVPQGECIEGFDLNAMVDAIRKDSHFNFSQMPTVGIINTDVLNAFATGRHKSHAGIAVTSGLLKKANEFAPSTPYTAQELVQAVLLHELGHIRNGDIVTNSTASLMAYAVNRLAQSLYDKTFKDEKKSAKSKNQNTQHEKSEPSKTQHDWLKPIAFIAGWFSGIITLLLTRWVSRTRETAADETAFDCGHGGAMQYALEMLRSGSYKNVSGKSIASQNLNEARRFEALMPALFCHHHTSQLSNTINHVQQKQDYWQKTFRTITTLFSTHPHIDDRIEHLKNLEKERDARIQLHM